MKKMWHLHEIYYVGKRRMQKEHRGTKPIWNLRHLCWALMKISGVNVKKKKKNELLPQPHMLVNNLPEIEQKLMS